MRSFARLAVLVVMLIAAPAAHADFGPAGFGSPLVVGSGPVASSALAVGRGDQAALAWVTPSGPQGVASDAVVVVRGMPSTQAWGPSEIVAPGVVDSDPPLSRLQIQVAAGNVTVVAWAEARYRRNRVVAAIAPPGKPFGPAQVIANVANGYAATPRLVATSSGRFVIVWRDSPWGHSERRELRYALSDGRSFGRAHLLDKRAASVALVAADDGGVVAAWRAPSAVRSARLAPSASRFGLSRFIAGSASVGPRLSCGASGKIVASWISRSGKLLTRQIRPVRPAKPLAQTTPQPEGRSPGAAAVGVGPEQSSIAAFVLFEPSGGRAWTATLAPSGRWRAPQPLGDASPHTLGGIRAVVSTSGEGFAMWQQSVGPSDAPTLEVVVAHRPRGSSGFEAPVHLGPGVPGVDPRGMLALTQSAGLILAAWPSPDAAGGMLLATRPDH